MSEVVVGFWFGGAAVGEVMSTPLHGFVPGEQRVVTPLERVTGGGSRGSLDMAGWEPFRNVDMDAQVSA